MDGEHLAVVALQRQEGELEVVVGKGRGAAHWVDVRLERHQRREVAARVAKRERRLVAEGGVPQQRQVDALEARVAQRLAAEALDEFDAVDDDWPPQHVRQREHVQLLEAGARLRSQRQQRRPVLFPLRLVQREVHQRRLNALVLTPPLQ